jgi:23S rRNA U2552 (ribose-2'-O)-methylase RlmE/FtsJ
MSYTILETWGHGGPSITPLLLAPERSQAFTPRIAPTPESRALSQCKNEINYFYQEGKWDDYKKITNPYEYIFLSWNRRSSRSVATRQPLSRSYFKMIELWKRLDLDTHLASLATPTGLITAHAAEGPGGFIEACVTRAQACKWGFQSATAITLRSDAKNVPGWRKASRFLTANPQVCIHDGADGTGNILLRGNQDAFVTTVREAYPAGVHIFTADGGFDFSNDYNAQEDSVFPLLLAEVFLGLRVLAKGGCLVIKCFDTVEQPTLDLLWLTTRAFCQWGIVKPRTSRAGNAERYIVGIGFLDNCADVLSLFDAYQTAGKFKQPMLAAPESAEFRDFIHRIAELQEQIEHAEMLVIRETLDLIKTTDTNTIKRLVRANVQRSIEWCIEHEEEVAVGWTAELERNVQKETTDLHHILNPQTNAVSYGHTSWYSKNTTASITFHGFRDGTMVPVSDSNPFMRLKKTTASS